MLHSTEDNFLLTDIFFHSEFHHSKDEIEALLFHPGCIFLRRLNQIEKSALQKFFFFLRSQRDPQGQPCQTSDPRSCVDLGIWVPDYRTIRIEWIEAWAGLWSIRDALQPEAV